MQTRWAAESVVVGWTRRVLPTVVRWTIRPPGTSVTYHLTQTLTGYGAFNEYRHQFGIIASPECTHCKVPGDDVDHTLFSSLYGNNQRMTISAMLGKPVGETEVAALLCGDDANLAT